MKLHLKKSLVALASASLLVAALAPITSLPTPAASAQVAASEDQTSTRARRLEGVWDSQVKFVNPQTGATLLAFRGLSMYIQGGAVNATNTIPNAPRTIGPSVGHWEYLGGKKYLVRFRFFLFNPDGSLAGSQRVTRTLTLNSGARAFTGVVATEVLDPNDNVVLQLDGGTETSVRVE